jgi:hypothetical protein
LSADFEISVTETAQLEWNNTVKATFVRDGDEDSDIFVIDRFTLQASEQPRDAISFTHRSSVPLISFGADFHFSFITDIADRRADQGATGRLGMMRVAEYRVRT